MQINGLKVYSIDELDSQKSKDKYKYYLDNNFSQLMLNHKSSIFDELITDSMTKPDLELAIKMDNHSFFKQLSEFDANSEELWATLNIEYFSEYTYTRWLKDKESEKIVLERVFKKGKSLYNRNSLARLWWITRMTKDNNLDDPYKLTKLVLENGQIDQSVMESSLCKNKTLVKNILKAISNYEENTNKLSSSQVKTYMKELNKLGGTFVLDIMDETYFYSVLLSLFE